MSMKLAKSISAAGIVAMTAALIYGFTLGNFSKDGAALLNNPWGIVSLIDLYTGFALFSMWIIYREKSPGRAAVWIVLMLLLGFFSGSLYTLIALNNSRGDWKIFWLGQRANE